MTGMPGPASAPPPGIVLFPDVPSEAASEVIAHGKM